jgi:hypothetical protein
MTRRKKRTRNLLRGINKSRRSTSRRRRRSTSRRRRRSTSRKRRRSTSRKRRRSTSRRRRKGKMEPEPEPTQQTRTRSRGIWGKEGSGNLITPEHGGFSGDEATGVCGVCGVAPAACPCKYVHKEEHLVTGFENIIEAAKEMWTDCPQCSSMSVQVAESLCATHVPTLQFASYGGVDPHLNPVICKKCRKYCFVGTDLGKFPCVVALPISLPLPPGWASAVSRSTGKVYYVNLQTNETQWTFPGDDL